MITQPEQKTQPERIEELRKVLKTTLGVYYDELYKFSYDILFEASSPSSLKRSGKRYIAFSETTFPQIFYHFRKLIIYDLQQEGKLPFGYGKLESFINDLMPPEQDS